MPRESKQAKRERAIQISEWLKQQYPNATTALHWRNPFELLVATILSAQCTDETVNKVTQELFKKYRKPEDYAAAPLEQLEQDIYSTGFYRRKAQSVKHTAQSVLDEFGGNVPDNMADMLELAGVARKTANVVLGTALGRATGIVVDTHVKRLAGRMGLSKQSNPDKIEQDLMELLPRDEWIEFAHAMIWHGRRVCDARKPLCAECGLEDICPKIGVS